jgi:fructose-1,6-bisphosphatase/inositol monophosphatase family enzyme
MIEEISQIIRNCAAEIILPRFRNLKDDDVTTKTGPRDLVTIADTEAEYYLQKHIKQYLESALIVGEESISRGEYDLSDIHAHGDQPIFVVDPIDGTNNFVKGSDVFGVMVAMLINGVCHKAWIYDVVNDKMTTAAKGEGAHTNGKPIKVSTTDETQALTGYTSLRYMNKVDKAHFLAYGQGVNMVDSTGCAAHMYLDVAHGRKDFTMFTRLKPWDHLPGVLICQEAGAYAANWDGSPYDINSRHIKPSVSGVRAGILSTNSEKTWRILHDMLISSLHR